MEQVSTDRSVHELSIDKCSREYVSSGSSKEENFQADVERERYSLHDDNYYVKKISEGTLTCEPCPKNTALVRDASNLEAQSELMCKCIPGLVDLRLPGMLPENFTITSSLSVSPCVSPIKYCQDMTSNLKEYPSECVEFFNGAPVQILTNYYRFKFDRWTWNFP